MTTQPHKQTGEIFNDVTRIGRVHQKVSFTGTSAQSSAVDCTMIGLFATQDCWIVFGSNPTAASNNGSCRFLPGGIQFHFRIKDGDKIAVIQDSASGDLHIAEEE